ncbi:MAG TPA: hypothetical protein VHG28_10825 [Longimicrobiaceae bacterium]|nr:hypothetical protein [Longimicrobiaceae bacterium]
MRIIVQRQPGTCVSEGAAFGYAAAFRDLVQGAYRVRVVTRNERDRVPGDAMVMDTVVQVVAPRGAARRP